MTVILRIRLVLIELFKNYKVYRKIGREKTVTKDNLYQLVLPGKLVVLHSSIFVTELLVKVYVKVTKYVRQHLECPAKQPAAEASYTVNRRKKCN